METAGKNIGWLFISREMLNYEIQIYLENSIIYFFLNNN